MEGVGGAVLILLLVVAEDRSDGNEAGVARKVATDGADDEDDEEGHTRCCSPVLAHLATWSWSVRVPDTTLERTSRDWPPTETGEGAAIEPGETSTGPSRLVVAALSPCGPRFLGAAKTHSTSLLTHD